MKNFEIRRARPADAPSAGNLQVDAWRFTYAGFMPEAYLRGLSYEAATEQWARALRAEDPGAPRWVALQEEEVMAYLAAGPARYEILGYSEELYALYTKPGLQRAGLGRALLETYVAWLKAEGKRAFHLWAGRQNTRAHAFYEAMGGNKIAEREDREFGGLRIVEWAFGWKF